MTGRQPGGNLLQLAYHLVTNNAVTSIVGRKQIPAGFRQVR